ncbi:MAG: hypothetical protein ACRDSF_12145 [Pseudonocardiaceae bacterium]
MPESYRKRLVLLTATLGIVTCGLLGAGTASAGTNGQQINYYSHYSYAQCTVGTNQNGESIQNCTQLRIGSNPDQGYWWIGLVDITWYHSDRSHVSSTCGVPKSQDGDYFTCYEPS